MIQGGPAVLLLGEAIEHAAIVQPESDAVAYAILVGMHGCDHRCREWKSNSRQSQPERVGRGAQHQVFDLLGHKLHYIQHADAVQRRKRFLPFKPR